MSRERQYDESHFYRTHIESRKAILEIAKEHAEVRIKVIKSSVTSENEMVFEEECFSSRKAQIAYLEEQQYTKNKISKIIY